MEILQNIGTSSPLQSLMTSATPKAEVPVSNSSDNPDARNGSIAITTSALTTDFPSIGDDNHLLDDITDLQTLSNDHCIATKSSIADIILGSGDNSITTGSVPYSHSPNLDEVNTVCEPLGVPETGVVVDNLATAIEVDEPEESPEVNVAINNVVCTFSTRCHLNLRHIALNGCNVELKKAQGMLNMKIRKPSATASIWSSGKITVTGASSEDNCKIAARRIGRTLQKIGFPVKFSGFKIVNVLGTCSLPFGIRLTDFSRENLSKVEYEPELHPGATYKIKDIHATLKIFSTGSITITAPKVQNIQIAVEHVFPLVYPFKKPKRIDPKEVAYIKDIMEADSEAEVISDNSDLDLEPGEIPSTKSHRYSLQPAQQQAQQQIRSRVPARAPARAPGVPVRKHSLAILPTTVINDDDYGSSSEEEFDSDESL